MAHPHHPQYPQQPSPYSPHSPIPPPHPYNGPPPPQQIKRQTLSPQSPNAYGVPPHPSHPMSNGTIPNTAFNGPQQPPQYPANGYHPHPQMNAPPTPTTGNMAPPARPVEEKSADLNDLSDVLFAAGVDLRSEEAALVRDNYHAQHGTTPVGTSFNSALSQGSQQAFDNGPHLSQFSPGDRSSFYGAGSFNQAAITPVAMEKQLERQRMEAIRNKSYAMQFHMNDPFIYPKWLYTRLLRKVKDNHLRPPQGLAVHRNEISPPHYQTYITHLPRVDTDFEGHLVAVNLEGDRQKSSNAILPSHGSIADITTLLSLAARERIRSLVEDAAALARGRCITSQGIIPADLEDLAVGQGERKETTPVADPTGKSLKRSFSEVNSLPTPVSDNQSSPQKATSFPNVLATTLVKAYESDNALEEARAAKRSKRNVDSLISGDANRTGSAAGSSGPGTPGTIGERAPDVPKKGLSKKEQKRQQDAKASEAQQHAATNNSLSMALGTSGNLFGGKKISWMSSKKPAMESGFGPSRLNAASQKAAAAKADKPAATSKLGDFREDREGGDRLQLRDLIAVLEAEPKEKRTLSKAYGRQDSKKK